MPMWSLQVLAEKLAEGLPIQHGVVVDRIDWGGEGVTVHCQGGEQVQADAVIVTVSLGVLKVQMLLPSCACMYYVIVHLSSVLWCMPSEAWVKHPNDIGEWVPSEAVVCASAFTQHQPVGSST